MNICLGPQPFRDKSDEVFLWFGRAIMCSNGGAPVGRDTYIREVAVRAADMPDDL